MLELQTENINFKSSNGVDTVAGYFFTVPDVTPRAILQISHGMCEYIGRYKEFAEFMASHGFAVCGNDHIGHGNTSGNTKMNGYFGEKDGRYSVLKDLKKMNDEARRRYPDLPLILLGHSMGSFFARWFAAEYPNAIDGLIISGTGGPNPLAGMGIGLSSMIAKIKGPKYISHFLDRMAFGSFLKKIEKPNTPYDWITRDTEIVARYAQDAKCTFVFTCSAFHELFSTLKEVSTFAWAEKITKDMPVWVFSGDMDPVGDYGRGVQKVAEMLQQAGVKDLTLTLYPEGRHEMLNEINREQVYNDVLCWIERHLEIKE